MLLRALLGLGPGRREWESLEAAREAEASLREKEARAAWAAEALRNMANLGENMAWLLGKLAE